MAHPTFILTTRMQSRIPRLAYIFKRLKRGNQQQQKGRGNTIIIGMQNTLDKFGRFFPVIRT